jgi:hypothetical protein
MAINPDGPTPMPSVNRDPINAQIATFARDIGLVVGAMTALLGLISKKDWPGIIAFMQSSNALTAAGILATVAIPVWRQFSARWNRQLLVKAAQSPANTVVNVKG